MEDKKSQNDEIARSAAELSKLFAQTPEMIEHRQVSGAINNQLDQDDTVPVQLNVPRQFVRLVEFLEQKRAVDEQVTPDSVEKTLNQTMLNMLHQDLHMLITEPLTFPYYQGLWNRFCDVQGAPEQKVGQPEEKEEGPF